MNYRAPRFYRPQNPGAWFSATIQSIVSGVVPCCFPQDYEGWYHCFYLMQKLSLSPPKKHRCITKKQTGPNIKN